MKSLEKKLRRQLRELGYCLKVSTAQSGGRQLVSGTIWACTKSLMAITLWQGMSMTRRSKTWKHGFTKDSKMTSGCSLEVMANERYHLSN